MSESDKTEDLKGKRVLLAGASIFILMPILIYLFSKVVDDSFFFNPKFFIGVIIGGAILIDHYFVKVYKNKIK